jgi:hypothetical protein
LTFSDLVAVLVVAFLALEEEVGAFLALAEVVGAFLVAVVAVAVVDELL